MTLTRSPEDTTSRWTKGWEPIPGREIDATFALQVKRVATAKQQEALDSYRTL